MIEVWDANWTAPQPLAEPRVIAGRPEGSMALGHDNTIRTFGLWEVTPGSFRAQSSSRDEIVHILAGHGELRSNDGTTIALAPGTICTIAAGFDGEWHVTETIRKFFVLTPVP